MVDRRVKEEQVFLAGTEKQRRTGRGEKVFIQCTKFGRKFGREKKWDAGAAERRFGWHEALIGLLSASY